MTYLQNVWRSLALAAFISALSACGGAGGNNDRPQTPPQAAVSAPGILKQPQQLSVQEGDAASFTVQAQGDTLSFQWLRDGVDINGANGATLSLASVSAADSGARFSCRISNSAGKVVSDSATLSVTGKAALGISQQPANVSVRVGQKASFAVEASGSGPFTYQWMLADVAIPGATASTYETPAATLADSGRLYSVKVSNAGGAVTSSRASLTVIASADTGGVHIPFMTGEAVGGAPAWAAVPEQGGAVVPVMPAGQASSVNQFPQFVHNGGFTDVHMRAMLFWKNDGLYRQDLFASNVLAAPSRVTTLTRGGAGLCEGDPDGNVVVGFDVAEAMKSWRVFRQKGMDGDCGTVDDAFLAIRLDMAGTEPALSIHRPVGMIRTAKGELAGWLLRQGIQLVRTDSDFSNPKVYSALPANDNGWANSGWDILPGLFLYVSAGKAYVLDASTLAVRHPVEVAELSILESIGQVLPIDAQTVAIAIRGVNTTRLVRFSSAGMTSQELGTLPLKFSRLFVTPTRLVVSDNAGRLMAISVAGGEAKNVYTPATPGIGLDPFHLAQAQMTNANERFWQQVGDSVVSVNSDGGGGQTLPGSRLVGCIWSRELTFANSVCDCVVVLQGTTLRTYDAVTGSPRVIYGTISPPAEQLRPTTILASSLSWGRGAVVTVLTHRLDGGAMVAADSYYFKTDQPGLKRLTLP